MTSSFPLTSPGFWRGYLVTTRPYLCFLSGVTGLVGLALPATEERATHPGVLAIALFAFFLTYGFGQALTDVFQVDTDSLSSPYRPLTQGLLRPRDVFGISLLGLALCGAFFASVSWWTLPVSALGIVGLGTYTPFKRRWWAGPLYNGGIVALLPLLGAAVAGLSPPQALADPRVVAAMLSAFGSYAVFVLLGYHKDVAADRASGYATLPVRFGWRRSVAVSAGFTLLAAVSSGALLVLGGATAAPTAPRLVSVALVVAGLASLAWAHRVMLSPRVMRAHPPEAEAHRSIAWVVRGYVWLHLGEASALAPWLLLPALAYAALFEAVLAARPERTQI